MVGNKMTLYKGDIIATEVQRADDGSLVADATTWNRIDHFDFYSDVSHLNEGDRLSVRIISSGKYGTYVEPIDITDRMIRVTLTPGSRLATPTNAAYREQIQLNETPLVEGLADVRVTDVSKTFDGRICSYDNSPPEVGDQFRTHIDRGPGPIRVHPSNQNYELFLREDVLVTGEAEIEITEVGYPMEGKINSYYGNLPEIGDSFHTKVRDRSGPHRIPSPDGRYEVHLDEDIWVSDEVEIKITEHGLPMRGHVNSYCGNLPEIGQSLNVELDHGPDAQSVRSPDGRYTLSIDEYVLVSGKTEIKLTEYGIPMKAQIVGYRTELPAVGETITAKVRAMQRNVESPTGAFQIELSEGAPRSGKARIEITNVSEAIYGKIRELESIDQDLSTYRSPWKANIVDNRNITKRKL